jgi:hypothetical protein
LLVCEDEWDVVFFAAAALERPAASRRMSLDITAYTFVVLTGGVHGA